jgi:pimeloyl-ACP methyl ester carboxylesterase
MADEPFVDPDELERLTTQLQIPIMLIRGKLSDVVSPEGVEQFLATVPHAEFVELSDAGHTAAGDDNDAFSETVVAFATR